MVTSDKSSSTKPGTGNFIVDFAAWGTLCVVVLVFAYVAFCNSLGVAQVGYTQ